MTTKQSYDPNGRYRVTQPISHPEATHADGCIRPNRDGNNVIVSMAHRASQPDQIKRLVEELKVLAYVGPSEKPAAKS